MRKSLFTIAIVALSLAAVTGFAQSGSITTKINKASSRVIFAVADTSANEAYGTLGSAEAAAVAFIGDNAVTLQIADPTELEIGEVRGDQIGMVHVHFVQKHSAIPVYTSSVIVHLSSKFIPVSVSVDYGSKLRERTTTRVTAKDAEALGVKTWRKDQGTKVKPTVYSIKRYILSSQVTGNTNSTIAYRVWKVDVGTELAGSTTYFFDTTNSKVRAKADNNVGISRVIKDCTGEGVPNPTTCPSNLYNATYQYTFGREEAAPVRGPNPRFMPSVYTENDKLYDLYNGIQNYWLTHFGLNGANGLGGTGNGTTYPVTQTTGHTYVDYLAAFAGCPTIAWFNPSTTQLAFCKSAVFPDVVAHEYGHVVSFNAIRQGGIPTGFSNLYRESRALNEGYSNFWGEMYEASVNGNADWIHAGPGAPHGTVTILSDPTIGTTGYPAMGDRFYSSKIDCVGDNSSNSPYTIATVLTKATYLLDTGGSFNGCTVSPVNRLVVEQILYRALTQYMISAETVNGAYYKINQACADLYGVGSQICTQVNRAFQAVEMDQAGLCSGLPESVPPCIDLEGF